MDDFAGFSRDQPASRVRARNGSRCSLLVHPPRAAQLASRHEADIAPPHSSMSVGSITSNLTADSYQHMVDGLSNTSTPGMSFRSICLNALCPARCWSLELYLQLRNKNPAPYAGYFDLGEWQICSTSPECFLKFHDLKSKPAPSRGREDGLATRGRPVRRRRTPIE